MELIKFGKAKRIKPLPTDIIIDRDEVIDDLYLQITVLCRNNIYSILDKYKIRKKDTKEINREFEIILNMFEKVE